MLRIAARSSNLNSMKRALALAGFATALFGCGGNVDPIFESVLEPEDTYDAVGPYRIEAFITARDPLNWVVLRVAQDNATRFGELLATLERGDVKEGLWVAELPGRPAGSRFDFYLAAEDRTGKSAFYPANAPIDLIGFAILPPP
jgi:hypothetical protein